MKLQCSWDTATIRGVNVSFFKDHRYVLLSNIGVGGSSSHVSESSRTRWITDDRRAGGAYLHFLRAEIALKYRGPPCFGSFFVF